MYLKNTILWVNFQDGNHDIFTMFSFLLISPKESISNYDLQRCWNIDSISTKIKIILVTDHSFDKSTSFKTLPKEQEDW